MMAMPRTIVFFKNYFEAFFDAQSKKVQGKILWTLDLVRTLDRIPENYFKHLENQDGLFEIRVEVGSDAFRIFCFFDAGNLVVLGNGFQKKTQKTPKQELEKAVKIKSEYHADKQSQKL